MTISILFDLWVTEWTRVYVCEVKLEHGAGERIPHYAHAHTRTPGPRRYRGGSETWLGQCNREYKLGLLSYIVLPAFVWMGHAGNHTFGRNTTCSRWVDIILLLDPYIYSSVMLFYSEFFKLSWDDCSHARVWMEGVK